MAVGDYQPMSTGALDFLESALTKPGIRAINEGDPGRFEQLQSVLVEAGKRFDHPVADRVPKISHLEGFIVE